MLFDHSGASQILSGVVERSADWYRKSNVQLGASYGRSLVASERLQQAQAALARLIGAASPAEVVVGPAATQRVFSHSQALAQGFVAGDDSIVSATDHTANVVPWQRLAARGMVIHFWPVDPDTGRLDAQALSAELARPLSLLYLPAAPPGFPIICARLGPATGSRLERHRCARVHAGSATARLAGFQTRPTCHPAGHLGRRTAA